MRKRDHNLHRVSITKKKNNTCLVEVQRKKKMIS